MSDRYQNQNSQPGGGGGTPKTAQNQAVFNQQGLQNNQRGGAKQNRQKGGNRRSNQGPANNQRFHQGKAPI